MKKTLTRDGLGGLAQWLAAGLVDAVMKVNGHVDNHSAAATGFIAGFECALALLEEGVDTSMVTLDKVPRAALLNMLDECNRLGVEHPRSKN